MDTQQLFPRELDESAIAKPLEESNGVRRKTLLTQGAFHYSGQAASVLSSIILVPLFLHRLGSEAYGFWLFALSIPSLAAGLDGVFYLSIARETAICSVTGRISEPRSRAFLSACFGACFIFGILCAVFIVFGGEQIVSRMGLSASLRHSALYVLIAVAIGFAAGRTVVFANAVLSGLQRFGTINLISIGALLIRFAGFATLSLGPNAIRNIAGWYAAVAVAESLLAVGLAASRGAVLPNRSLLEWRRLSVVGNFGLLTLVTTLLQNIFWLTPPLLLGILTGGTTATFTLYAGQRPCIIVSELNWRGAEVVFSAAAERQQGETRDQEQLTVFAATWILAVALPLCIGLGALAPVLVTQWLGIAASGAVPVMRLAAVAVIGDALWVAPMHVLWGRGQTKSVLWISLAIAIGSVLLNLVLIPFFGAMGAGLTFAIFSWAAAVATLIVAARSTGSSWLGWMRQAVAPLIVPTAALVTVMSLAEFLLHAHPRVQLGAATGIGGALYVLLLWAGQHRTTNANPIARPFFAQKFGNQ